MIATQPDKVAIDTNILLYAYDFQADARHEIAERIVQELLVEHRLILPAQVLNEFYINAVRSRTNTIMLPEAARAVIVRLAVSCEIVPLAYSTTLLALDCIERHGMSFWDALIWAAAKEGGAQTLYTEDFQHGREIDGVQILNPFLPATNL